MKKFFLFPLLSFSLLFFISGAFLAHTFEVQAASGDTSSVGDDVVNPSNTTIKLNNPINCGASECTIPTFLRMIIDNIVLPIGGVLAVLAFMYSGFLYVMARGNQAKLEVAHRALLYTAIGTLLLLGSWAIAQVIGNTVEQIT